MQLFNQNKHWYHNKKSEIENNKEVISRAKHLIKDLNYFYGTLKVFQDLYQNRVITQNQEQNYNTEGYSQNYTESLYTYNLVRACCNTAHSKIAKLTPKVTFLTKNAKREVQNEVKRIDN